MNIGVRHGKLDLHSYTKQAVAGSVQKLRGMGVFETGRELGERQRAPGEEIHKACFVVTTIATEGMPQ